MESAFAHRAIGNYLPEIISKDTEGQLQKRVNLNQGQLRPIHLT